MKYLLLFILLSICGCAERVSVTLSNGKQIVCENWVQGYCGVDFIECSDGEVHSCQTNASFHGLNK